MRYVKHKSRDNPGICNLCRLEKKLSWDHVPPKGAISLSPVEMRSIAQIMTMSKANQKPRFCQDGVKFRTICEDCNGMLGREFDLTLKEFSIAVSRYLKSSLRLPEKASFKTKPNRLARAILGHLVAAKVDVEPSLFDDKVHDLFASTSHSLPTDINIYYWAYPYDTTIVMRDFALADFGEEQKNIPFCQMLKYFPVAYLVSTTSTFEGLPKLNPLLSEGLDEEIEVPIDFNHAKHHSWPERPEGMRVLFGGEAMMNSVHANPKHPVIRG